MKVKTRIFKSLLPVILLAIIASCNKKPDTIGLDLVDHNQLLVSDTVFSVYAISSKEDSLISDETSYNLLGSQWTNTFGLTVASFYSHLRLSEVSPDFGTDPHVDSAFLTLVYADYYGYINFPLRVRVYEVAEDFYQADTVYYSNKKFEVLDTELANYYFTPSPEDSVVVNDSTKTAAQLKIPMSDEFINKIFFAEDTNLSSNDLFIQYFKGIYVTVDSVTFPGAGSILNFNLLNSGSKVTFYYNDSLTYTLVFNTNTARVQNYYHNFSKSTDQNFVNQIINNDTVTGEQNLYLQGLSGIKTKIFFPDLAKWWGKNKHAINEALLIIPAAEGGSFYPVPEKLILLQQNEDSTASILVDQNVGDAYFGGSLDDTSNSYQFRITLYIQELLKDSSDYGLLLYPSGKTIRANEVMLHGTHNSEPDISRMELRLIYTKLD